MIALSINGQTKGQNMETLKKFLEQLKKLISDFEATLSKPVDPPREDVGTPGQKLLWVPFASIKEAMKGSGTYRKGYPEGAIVHWTSGWSRDGEKGASARKRAEEAVTWGAKQGYAYFAIGEDGSIIQSLPLNRWGHHAGSSSWPSLGSSVSQYLVGIEICNAGKLKNVADGVYESWFGARFKSDEVRYSKKNGNIQEGYYHKYSAAQEASLIQLLKWLKSNNPEVFSYDLVLGHDEVAPSRKTDPGASLSMTMPEFRALLKS
jgi:N-acetylmuramoyl-L-alanine amidase